MTSLVGTRLDDAVVARRIQRANKASESKTGQITDLYRLFLHYALFITSLPATYTMKQLFALYRIRWQIELTFKVWKSILAIHHIRSAKEERVLCEVSGKLVLAVLISALCATARSFLDGLKVSIHKAARHGRAIATNWAIAIQLGEAVPRRFTEDLGRTMARLRRKPSHKRKPTIEDVARRGIAQPRSRGQPGGSRGISLMAMPFRRWCYSLNPARR